MANVVTLDEVRRHLRYPVADTQDDAAIQLFIDAADEVMKKECGANVAIQYDEYYDGGDSAIFLFNTPVLSIELVEEGWGFATFNLDYVQVDSPVVATNFAYSIDDAENGYITRRTSGNVLIPFQPGTNNIHFVYTAGRNPIPPIIKLAELELIAHWWQNSQQRAGVQATQNSFAAVDYEIPRSGGAQYTSINQGVPWRIIEMIKPYRSAPIIG